MSTACAALTRIATFRIPSLHSFNLIVSRGSVVDFSYQANNIQSAIVNAANEKCLGGGGVDGAISSAGGTNLYQDRLNLPIVNGIRCKTGTAVLTGPNTYDKLHTSHVIHAVGPNYHQYKSLEEGDILLSSAYTSSLQCAKDFHLEAVAFSLLSAGVYRGRRTVKEVLQIGLEAIYDFDGYEELNEVHMCAFSEIEANTLLENANDMGLKSIGESESSQCNIL